MKANDGCDTCEKNCMNKDMNAYNYCPNYVEDVNKKKMIYLRIYGDTCKYTTNFVA